MFSARLKRTHRFLSQVSFYAMALCTFVAIGFLEARRHIAHSGQFNFLIWNLFLAWVPYGLSLALIGLSRMRPVREIWIWIVGLAWLAFFPNAPYILTDFIHFREPSPFAWWYDLGIILACAWTGCFLGVTSLRIVQSLVRPVIGTAWSWVFVLLTIGLSGVGIWMGRIGRLNSWDVITDPEGMASRSYHWLGYGNHRTPVGMSVMFALLLLVSYLTVVSAQADPLKE